jgi:hypothetical protein
MAFLFIAGRNKILWLLCLLPLWMRCSPELEKPALTAGLHVEVVNSANHKVAGALVRVYSSAEDWQNEVNAGAEGVTDKNGLAKLPASPGQRYYIKVTWFSYPRREVYQNTLVSYKPTDPLPEFSTSLYQVKINYARELKGILIRSVTFNGASTGCDRYYSTYYTNYFGCSFTLREASGPDCDLYLRLTDQEDYTPRSWLYQSEVRPDIAAARFPQTFEANYTITAFGKPLYLSLRNHFLINPDQYQSAPGNCGPGSLSFADYLRSETGQQELFTRAGNTLIQMALITPDNKGILPTYPVAEFEYETQYSGKVKLILQWLY